MPVSTPHAGATVAQVQIFVNGTEITSSELEDVLEVTVETTLHVPELCTVRIEDNSQVSRGSFDYIDSAKFDPGKELKIKTGFGSTLTELFVGEIVAADYDFAGEKISFVVRAMSKAHRLHRGRKKRTFLKQKDSDIVSRIIGEAGLSCEASTTTVTNEFVFQNSLSDYEFLCMLADRNGYELCFADNKVCFKKPTTSAPEVELTYLEQLESFRPRLSNVGQVNKVEVRSWDMEGKSAIIGTAERDPAKEPQVGLAKSGGVHAKSAFGDSTLHVVNRPLQSVDDARNRAQAVLDDSMHNHIEADGFCQGEPKLKAGAKVKIQKVGTRFSGTYFVTSATHIYNAKEGYKTLFSVAGRKPVSPLLAADTAASDRPGKINGVVVAIVTNLQDPKNLGRIKVKYPWLDDQLESDWVRIASPMAGPERGFLFMPEINDEILVAFEHGDIERPYMIGALWNGVDKPVEQNNVAAKGGKVLHRIIKTRIGHTVMLDDDPATQQVYVLSEDKREVKLDDKNKKITVDDGKGNKITIDSNDNSMKLECNGDFTVDSKGKVLIKGVSGIEMTTPAQFQVKASTGVEIKSDTTMTLQSNASTEVKTSGIMQIQGSLVKIN